MAQTCNFMEVSLVIKKGEVDFSPPNHITEVSS